MKGKTGQHHNFLRACCNGKTSARVLAAASNTVQFSNVLNFVIRQRENTIKYDIDHFIFVADCD